MRVEYLAKKDMTNIDRNRTVEIGVETKETHSEVKQISRDATEISLDTKDIKRNTEETNKDTKEISNFLISLAEQNKLREEREAAEREAALQEKQRRRQRFKSAFSN